MNSCVVMQLLDAMEFLTSLNCFYNGGTFYRFGQLIQLRLLFSSQPDFKPYLPSFYDQACTYVMQKIIMSNPSTDNATCTARYERPWEIYSVDWCNYGREQYSQRLLISSFKESYSNIIEVASE